MKLPSLASYFAIVILLVLPACSDDADPVAPPSDKYTVTGTVQVKPGLEVADNLVLVGVWSVSSGSPDYVYVFGKGTVDFNTMKFTISYDKIPPLLALNDYSSQGKPSLGVSMIVLTDLKNTEPHKIGIADTSNFWGAVSNFGVIYIGGDPKKFETSTGSTWPSLFPSGYSIGKGVEQQTGFDTFVPSTEPLILIVTDDPKDIVFPNWT